MDKVELSMYLESARLPVELLALAGTGFILGGWQLRRRRIQRQPGVM
jgi:hypothetical protein